MPSPTYLLRTAIVTLIVVADATGLIIDEGERSRYNNGKKVLVDSERSGTRTKRTTLSK